MSDEFVGHDEFEKVVLSVEDVSFTYEEYIHFIKKNIKTSKNSGSREGIDHRVISLENVFLEQCLLFYEASKNGYDSSEQTLDVNERVAQYMVLQPGGLLTKYLIKDIFEVTPEMLEEARSRERIDFKLEYLHFASEYDMKLELEQDYPLRDGKVFSSYVAKLKNKQNLFAGELSWNWLSKLYTDIRDEVIDMDTGEISGPFSQNVGVLLLHVKSKEDKTLSNTNNDKNDSLLKKKIIKSEQEKLLVQFDRQIYEDSRIKFIDKNVDSFWRAVRNFDIHELDLFQYDSYKKMTLMEFHSPAQTKYVTVEDFMSFHKNLIVRRALGTKQQLIYYLKDIAWNSRALPFARNAGLFDDEIFLIDKKLHLIRVAINSLLSDKIGEIPENEIVERYTKNMHKYKNGDSLSVTLYEYDAKSKGQDALSFLLKQNISVWNDAIPKPLPENTSKVTLAIETPQMLSPKIMQEMKNSGSKVFSKLVQVGSDKYAVLINNGLRNGSIKPLSKVRNTISNQIERERVLPLRKQLLQKLRNTTEIRSSLSEVRSDVVKELLIQ